MNRHDRRAASKTTSRSDDHQWTLETGRARRAVLYTEHVARALEAWAETRATGEVDVVAFIADPADTMAHGIATACGTTIAAHAGIVIGTMRHADAARAVAHWNDSDAAAAGMASPLRADAMRLLVIGGNGSAVYEVPFDVVTQGERVWS